MKMYKYCFHHQKKKKKGKKTRLKKQLIKLCLINAKTPEKQVIKKYF